MSPNEALAVLHGLVEKMALDGQTRDVARTATHTLKKLVDAQPVDMGGGVPVEVKA